MREIVLLFGFVVFLFFSCKKQSKDESEDVQVIVQNLPSQESDVPLSNYYKINNIVRLSSSDSSIVDFVYKIVKDENIIFVKGGNSLFKFNTNGDFLKKLTKGIGGPNEYVNLTDVILLPEIKRIWLYDSNQRSILQYTYDFEFEINYSLDYPLFGIERLDSVLVGSPGYMNIFDEFNSVYFFEGQNLITGYKPLEGTLSFNPEKSNYLHIYRHDYFSKVTGGVNFVNSFNDTIYFIGNKSKITPRYLIDFGQSKVVEEDLVGNGYTSIVDVFQFIHSTEKSFNISNIVEFENSLIYKFYNQGKSFLSIFDKTESKVISGGKFSFDFNGQSVSIYLDEEISFGALGNNQAYMIIPAESSVIGKFQNLFDVSDGDNPIIFFFNEK